MKYQAKYPPDKDIIVVVAVVYESDHDNGKQLFVVNVSHLPRRPLPYFFFPTRFCSTVWPKPWRKSFCSPSEIQYGSPRGSLPLGVSAQSKMETVGIIVGSYNWGNGQENGNYRHYVVVILG